VIEFERQGLGRNENKKPYGLHLILTPKRRRFGFFNFFLIRYSYKYLYYYIYLIYIIIIIYIVGYRFVGYQLSVIGCGSVITDPDEHLIYSIT
jgi:hypothetical protein